MKTLTRKPAQWFQQLIVPPTREPEGYEVDDADPSAAMFAATRRRLTFWYTGILATLLLLSGVLLYFSMQAVWTVSAGLSFSPAEFYPFPHCK